MDDLAITLAAHHALNPEDDEDDRPLAALTFLAASMELMRQECARIRNPSRLYLTRQQLVPNPRYGTPWQCLYASQSDRGFITTMGFDIATFRSIIAAGFGKPWYEEPIPRSDIASRNARPGARSLDAEGALGLVLHYLNSTMRETSLQEIFALIPSTVSRYITFGLELLLRSLRGMPDAAIQWPRDRPEFARLNALIVPRHPLLAGAFASIDGLKLPIQTSSDEDVENATYNGWLSEHFVSSVLVFSPEGTIISAQINAPGSWHDSRVARPIYLQLLNDTPDGYYLVADTAFPRGTGCVAGRIRTPIKAGSALHGTHHEIKDRLQFDRQLLSFRQTAEWGNHGLQGSFGRLRVPLEVNNADRRGNLIEVCIRAFCLQSRRVGLNQIQTVYVPQWRGGDNNLDVWNHFENMLFSEQRRNDRVARFHIQADYNDE